jgi:hypothetical protein
MNGSMNGYKSERVWYCLDGKVDALVLTCYRQYLANYFSPLTGLKKVSRTETSGRLFEKTDLSDADLLAPRIHVSV